MLHYAGFAEDRQLITANYANQTLVLIALTFQQTHATAASMN